MPFTQGLKPTSPNQGRKESPLQEVIGFVGAVAFTAAFIALAGNVAEGISRQNIQPDKSLRTPTPAQVTSTPIPSPTPSQIPRLNLVK